MIDLLRKLVDFALHLDVHLDALMQQFGPWMYVLLFLIVFVETGLVILPFLPGDSLLFAVGALSARPGSPLNVIFASLVLVTAAIAGDSANYSIGRYLGERLIRRFPRLIKPAHLQRTHDFYEHYGGKTIVIARFVPLVRTLAPFVAGLGKMTYVRFMSYNVFGGVLWIILVVPAGYFFGNVRIVKENFSVVILLIIVISTLPAVVEFWRHRAAMNRARAANDQPASGRAPEAD